MRAECGNRAADLASAAPLAALTPQVSPLPLEYAAEALQADRAIVTAAVRQDCDALVFTAEALRADGWLQLLARRASSRLPERARAFLKLARDQADAAVQSKVDRFLIKRGLDASILGKHAAQAMTGAAVSAAMLRGMG